MFHHLNPLADRTTPRRRRETGPNQESEKPMMEGRDMKRILFGISALSCVLMLTPPVSAQQSINNDFVIENLCIPDSLQEEFGEQWILSELDLDQVELLRIQLLERGFDPGFHPNRDNTIDAQLMEALAQFQ